MSRERGNAILAAAIRILEGWGYIVQPARDHWVRRRGRWINVGGDLFGVFDLVAVAGPDTAGSPIRFVQTTDSSHAAARRKKIDARWSWPRIANELCVEVWAWAERGQEFVIWNRTDRGWDRLTGPRTSIRIREGHQAVEDRL